MTFDDLEVGDGFMFRGMFDRGMFLQCVKVTLDSYYSPSVDSAGSVMFPERSQVVTTDDYFIVNEDFFKFFINAFRRHTEEKLKRRQKRLGIANFYETIEKLDG
ncbi:hypothetical protein [Chroococcidiopsis sp.]|uniref:hypothetical protein n=1 Tax=Chroococcidiopsis sp. TaxID=3088168 RepID=UPI003F2A62D8